MASSTKTARLLALLQIALLVVAMASSVCHGARDAACISGIDRPGCLKPTYPCVHRPGTLWPRYGPGIPCGHRVPPYPHHTPAAAPPPNGEIPWP
ncbi:hypothetical protein SEVIR_4G240100v4 [Setaria viridis]|uniref:Hydrophobic seed protein domain-containing protein n=2 Tax=Setaria TaxID=4554 RepID=A0A368QZ26_SETIT|nr:hypothetical protein SETIT_4G228700v2 [Setaria italica]TKW22616.1 hypothetical protein SEVIR_4G240100v2 [Setaria viridis]